MLLNYQVTIDRPQNHLVKVRLTGKRETTDGALAFFLPSWSPGSYLMREYGRNVQRFRAQTGLGETIYFDQTAKGTWTVDWVATSDLKDATNFIIEYEVYCHELTVRTSHIDESHAFLHGPTYLMGVQGKEIVAPKISIHFPALWSKVSTGLKSISTDRNEFLYEAKNYDELLDSPIEIGCHLTDGFMVEGREHHLAFYGSTYQHHESLKDDIKKIVEHIAKTMGDIPYDQYLFITHFVPNLFGGLEHSNSTALQFDGRRLSDRKMYINWLALVAHEYFHTWNIKRIRPIELGPFDYTKENYTKMLWLAEGLTSFMDELFIYRAGLCTLEEYLDMQQKNLNRYMATPGRGFHSLEDSSFNAWVKLYRKDENTDNTSISYYLKGGIVFFILNILLVEKGSSINELLAELWSSYKYRPNRGLSDIEVYDMIEKLGGTDVKEKFEVMVTTTEDIDLELYFMKIGLTFSWEYNNTASLGIEKDYQGDRVFVKSVRLDGPAFKSGLNAGDEIIAISGQRVTKADFDDIERNLLYDRSYKFTVSRMGYITNIDVDMAKKPKTLKGIGIEDRVKADKFLL